MDRYCADRMVKRLTKTAGIDKKISPRDLRHSFITAAVNGWPKLGSGRDD